MEWWQPCRKKITESAKFLLSKSEKKIFQKRTYWYENFLSERSPGHVGCFFEFEKKVKNDNFSQKIM